MKKILISLLITLILFGCNSNNQNSYTQLDQNEAIRKMEELDQEYIILDVRTKPEYDQGHIEGAINFPNEDIQNGSFPNPENKDMIYFVYCRSGNRSKQASAKLVENGYTNIYEIGGINTWPGNIVE